MKKIALFLLGIACACAASAQIFLVGHEIDTVRLEGRLAQGEIVLGTAPWGANFVSLDGQNLPIAPNGKFLIAFGRDADSVCAVSFIRRFRLSTLDIRVAPTRWDVQRVPGLPAEKVSPSKRSEGEIQRERGDLRRALSFELAEPLWLKGFVRPVEGRVSGKFGGRRIMNGERKDPHSGLDIAAPEGSKVKAASDGVVALAGKDYFYTGSVVVLAHGHGLFTIYAHLREILVEAGDRVEQGETIGTVGRTGRANGPHLHWGASWNGTRFDPASLLELDKLLN